LGDRIGGSGFTRASYGKILQGFVQGNEDAMLNYFQAKTDEWVEKIKAHVYLDFAAINDCQLQANRFF
jgi:hypothetical protein